jgi:hypothetical protein
VRREELRQWTATVSKLLGHSEIATTLRTYAHAIEGAGREAVRGIDQQLARVVASGAIYQSQLPHGNRMATDAPKARVLPLKSGAGGGNRTRDSCLEGKGITIMQRPHTAGCRRRSSIWSAIYPAIRRFASMPPIYPPCGTRSIYC